MKPGIVLVISECSAGTCRLSDLLNVRGMPVLTVFSIEDARTYLRELHNLSAIVVDTSVAEEHWAPLRDCSRELHPNGMLLLISNDSGQRASQLTQQYNDRAVRVLPYKEDAIVEMIDRSVNEAIGANP